MVFPLCRRCAEETNLMDSCVHTSNDDRALSGVWSTCELKYAFQRRYQLLETYEMGHNRRILYDLHNVTER